MPDWKQAANIHITKPLGVTAIIYGWICMECGEFFEGEDHPEKCPKCEEHKKGKDNEKEQTT